MPQNPGVSPLDPGSAVGQVRLTIGDTQSSALTPPTFGQASYEWFSDAELAQFLVNGSGSIHRAVGYAIMQMALGFTLKGIVVKTDDLSLDASKRGSNLQEIALSYIAQADSADATDALDYFQFAPFGGFSSNRRVEGLAPLMTNFRI